MKLLNISASFIALVLVTTQQNGAMALPHNGINGNDVQELVKREGPQLQRRSICCGNPQGW